MRVYFSRQRGQEVRFNSTVAEPWFDSQKHLRLTSRGYRSRLIMSLMRIPFLYSICVLGSHVWLQSYIILNSVLGRVCVWIDVTWSPWRVVLEDKS